MTYVSYVNVWSVYGLSRRRSLRGGGGLLNNLQLLGGGVGTPARASANCWGGVLSPPRSAIE